MQRFDDRRIIITGAGSGIGQATVARLLEEGGTVVAFDVSAEGLRGDNGCRARTRVRPSG